MEHKLLVYADVNTHLLGGKHKYCEEKHRSSVRGY
jgi:hypothetical protein